MAIERRKSSPAASETVVTTSCPYCDKPIAEQESVAKHPREDCEAVGGDR